MEVIAIFPAVLSLAVCLLGSPAAAFLNVYLPVLLLIPDHFRWRVPGLPDPGFQHSAILPIACVLLFARRAAWRFSLMDLLVLGYAALIGCSEYRAAGWWNAQNLILDQVCTVLLPYALAKLLIQPEDIGTAFARRFTLLLALVAVLSIWEFRMGTRLFFETLWGQFFPGQAELAVQYRWNFGRVAGPFTHAILAGIIFGVALFLQAWLLHERGWKSGFRGLAVLGLLMLGSLLTMSRGPWLGILLGACVAVVGFVQDRTGVVLKLCLLALLIVPPTWQFFENYTASLHPESEEQHSAAYRTALVDAYMPKVWRQPELGYGSLTWPKDLTYPSIDNHYLLLALQHGVVVVGLLILMMLWAGMRLFAFGWARPPRDVSGSLAFALIGAIASIAVAILTVYLGAQVEPVLFMLLGWSEGLLVYGSVARRAETPAPSRRPQYSFQRVMT